MVVYPPGRIKMGRPISGSRFPRHAHRKRTVTVGLVAGLLRRTRLRRLRARGARSAIALERGAEGVLRNVYLAELPHLLLAFLLFLQKFSLAGDAAAIALCGVVLA